MLDTIEAVVKNYDDNVNLAERLAREGSTPQEIDRVIKINDTPALEALRDLDKVTITEQLSTGTAVSDLVAQSKSAQNIAFWIIGITLGSLIFGLSV